VVAVATVAGVLVHVQIENTPRDEARQRDLRRWYLGLATPPIPKDTVPELTSASGVKVVVFTNYRWNPKGRSVAEVTAQTDLFRQAGLPIEVDVRQFPPSECQAEAPAGGRRDASCEASYAVTLVGEVHGDRAAQAMADWLEARSAVLAHELIDSYLATLGLLEAYGSRYAELRERVAKDVALGRQLSVVSVPAYFIDGKRVPEARDGLASLLTFEAERRGVAPLPGG
jgi:hypothetical protein